MKRAGKYFISVVCVFMCCVFLMQYAAAEKTISAFSISNIVLTGLQFTSVSSGETKVVAKNVFGSFNGQIYHFDLVNQNMSFAVQSLSMYNWSLDFDIQGSFEQPSGMVPSDQDYLWLSFAVYSTFEMHTTYWGTINYDRLLDCALSLVAYLPNNQTLTLSDCFGISEVSDKEYLLSFLVPASYLEGYDLIHCSKWHLTLPVQFTSGTMGAQINAMNLRVDNFTLTYEIPPSTIIISGIDDIKSSLNSISNQISNGVNTVVNEIRTTQDIIEQLPDALRDLVVGEPYTKELDTSAISEYESQMAVVESKMDIPGAIGILDSGLDLNGGDSFSSASFTSVGDFMQRLIDAAEVGPLIAVTLSLGFAAYLLGRTKYLR